MSAVRRDPLRIAVTDPIMSAFADDLRRTERPHEWVFADLEVPGSARAAIAGADVVICSRLTADDMADGNRVHLVHATGAGVDRVDAGAVPDGVPLCNTGHHGAAIAEHVIMTALMLRRRALEADAEMRRGEWRTIATADAPYHRALAGSTLGLVGYGEIGRSVAHLAKAFGMRVVALRRHPDAGGPGTELLDRVYGEDHLHPLLAESDVVVVTAPLTESTRGMIDAAALAQLHGDALIINVARGALLDEDALYAALDEGRIGGAAIDVWWDAPQGAEAPPVVQRFAALDRVVLTPHHSGHAREVFTARAADIARNIDLLDAGLPLERQVR
ncbi:2-hydroxyacid dehydrogenase [Microbacterium sp. Leaf320]|uniref:2-hydroxyacid dehydrogenase n=1 Tax=Microbacterium sp. Leaf320 TaxID=1736334 RepID=UPI000B265FA6|nr:2-hydroxyacid dehydrogenase [Microbacterium sp. Leaf320]